MSDMRDYRTFYGIHYNDWEFNFGTFSNHHKILVDEYMNEMCSCATSSAATDTNEFLYVEHIKQIYFIEGVIQGEITVAASECTSTVTSYCVSVCKMHDDNTATTLFTTGWITTNDTLAWDAGHSIGEEVVYHFRIDAWEKEKLDEYERIYVKVEVNANACTVLWHSNDATWNDLWIEIPLIL